MLSIKNTLFHIFASLIITVLLPFFAVAVWLFLSFCAGAALFWGFSLWNCVRQNKRQNYACEIVLLLKITVPVNYYFIQRLLLCRLQKKTMFLTKFWVLAVCLFSEEQQLKKKDII